MLKNMALVALGGGLGSVVRYGVSLASALLISRHYPAGTLFVNVLGCFCIGLGLPFLSGKSSDAWRLFLIVGFLGGFTTFSAFGIEVYALFRTHPLWAWGHLLANNVLGLGGAALGAFFSQYGLNKVV